MRYYVNVNCILQIVKSVTPENTDLTQYFLEVSPIENFT